MIAMIRPLQELFCRCGKFSWRFAFCFLPFLTVFLWSTWMLTSIPCSGAASLWSGEYSGTGFLTGLGTWSAITAFAWWPTVSAMFFQLQSNEASVYRPLKALSILEPAISGLETEPIMVRGSTIDMPKKRKNLWFNLKWDLKEPSVRALKIAGDTSRPPVIALWGNMISAGFCMQEACNVLRYTVGENFPDVYSMDYPGYYNGGVANETNITGGVAALIRHVYKETGKAPVLIGYCLGTAIAVSATQHIRDAGDIHMVSKVVLLNPFASYKDGLENILQKPEAHEMVRKANALTGLLRSIYYLLRYVMFCSWLTKPLWSWNSFAHRENPWDTRSRIKTALEGIPLLILSNIGDRQAPSVHHRELYHLAGGQKLPDLSYDDLYENGDKTLTHHGRIRQTDASSALRAIIQVPGGHSFGIINFFRKGKCNCENSGIVLMVEERPEIVWEGAGKQRGPDFIAEFLTTPAKAEADKRSATKSRAEKSSSTSPTSVAPVVPSRTPVILIAIGALILVLGVTIWCCPCNRGTPESDDMHRPGPHRV